MPGLTRPRRASGSPGTRCHTRTHHVHLIPDFPTSRCPFWSLVSLFRRVPAAPSCTINVFLAIAVMKPQLSQARMIIAPLQRCLAIYTASLAFNLVLQIRSRNAEAICVMHSFSCGLPSSRRETVSTHHHVCKLQSSTYTPRHVVVPRIYTCKLVDRAFIHSKTGRISISVTK